MFLWDMIVKGICFDFKKKGICQIPRTLKKILFVMSRIPNSRFNGRQSDNLIKHPHFGHFCVEVNNGYKLFDLQEKVVIKLFSEKISLQIFHQELNRVRMVGTFNFAPTVNNWNIKERWYVEKCLEGYRPDDSTRPQISVFGLLGHF